MNQFTRFCWKGIKAIERHKSSYTIVFLIVISVFLPTAKLSAQEVSGKIVIDSTAKTQVIIENSTQNHRVYSSETGAFTIKAQFGDTLIVGSLFLQPKQIIVDSAALQSPIRIRLKKRRFDLAEVVVDAKGRDTLDVKKFNQEFQQKLARDIQKRPYLYSPSHGNIGDLLLFATRKIGDLLFGKREKPTKVIPSITADDLENLFAKEDPLFNADLLQNTLKIPSEKTYLFFIYCEDHHLSGKLLKQGHKFRLLDKLVKLAKEFSVNVK